MSFDSGTSPCEKAWHSWHSRDLRLLLISVFQPFDGRSAAAGLLQTLIRREHGNLRVSTLVNQNPTRTCCLPFSTPFFN